MKHLDQIRAATLLRLLNAGPGLSILGKGQTVRNLLTVKGPINPSGGKDRERRAVLNLKRRLERKYQRSINRVLRRASTVAASEARAGRDPLQSDYIQNGLRADLIKVLRTHGREVADTFALRVWSDIKSARSLEIKQDAIFFYQEWLDGWLAEHYTRRADAMGTTTADIIRRALQDADSDGLSMAQTASLIRRRTGGEFSAARASTIARTEVNAVANAGAEAAATATGEEFEREWLSVEDGRTRPTHMAADGQTRDVGEPFTVGGSSLMRPGDPSGPLKETVNCRCTLLFIPKE